MIVAVCLTCKSNVEESITENKDTYESLVGVFKYPNENLPKISVHRGGKGLVNYPENCLETLEFVDSKINAIYEIDVAKTSDNKLVLMHDNTLERTTTGQGVLEKQTFNALQDYFLKDDFGNVTAFKIPLFKAVLQWAKAHQVILTIDIKKSVALGDVIDVIREVKAESISIIITYDVDAAKAAHALAPDLLLSVSARNEQEWQWMLDSDIPLDRMLAFTGTRLSDVSLYKSIHDKGVLCMLGTLGNLDKQAETKGDALYHKWQAMGIDIIATDRPFEVANAIKLSKE